MNKNERAEPKKILSGKIAIRKKNQNHVVHCNLRRSHWLFVREINLNVDVFL